MFVDVYTQEKTIADKMKRHFIDLQKALHVERQRLYEDRFDKMHLGKLAENAADVTSPNVSR